MFNRFLALWTITIGKVVSLALPALLLLAAGNSGAAEVAGLYRVQIPVTDQSVAVREQALDAGLLKIVDRVSGTSAWRDSVDEQELLANTQRLLEQYGYARGNANAPLQLDAIFSGVALRALLAEYAVPVWGQNRPRVLFWIASDAGNRRQVISENTSPAMVDRLEQAMTYWGVPGMTPLMDLEDNAVLNVSDLWGFFAESVEAASTRYNSDAIVMARVSKDSAGRWKVLWQLRIDGRMIKQGQVKETSPQRWANRLVAGVAETLAAIYAVRLNSGFRDQLLLEVKGISAFRDYVDVSRLLNNLAPIKDALPGRIEGDAVQFALTLNGSQQQLIEHLALHQSLVPTLAENSDESGLLLVYLWQP